MVPVIPQCTGSYGAGLVCDKSNNGCCAGSLAQELWVRFSFLGSSWSSKYENITHAVQLKVTTACYIPFWKASRYIVIVYFIP